MRVLVACEYSGTVRDSFAAKGHEAWSCDLLPSLTPGKHYQGDVFRFIWLEEKMGRNFDLMIAHPPCTHLTNSASKHLYIDCKKDNGIYQINWDEMEEAAEFYNKFKEVKIQKKCTENPIMHCHARELVGGRATQYVQPWWFGSKKNKATGLKLENLPKLVKTNVVGPMPKTVKKGTKEYRDWNECWYMSPGEDRGIKRAKTDPAVAGAMAEQWG